MSGTGSRRSPGAPALTQSAPRGRMLTTVLSCGGPRREEIEPMARINRRSLLSGCAAVIAARILTPCIASAQAPAGPFKLDPLPYPATTNEPHIDAQTMEIHHDRHHAAYVSNLNQAASQGGEWVNRPLHEIMAYLNAVPESVRTAVRNNGGGHANHTMFWQIMGGPGGEPQGELKGAVERDFGSVQKFQDEFNAAGARLFGSRWVFVTVTLDGRLALVTKPTGHALDGRPVRSDGQRRLGARLLSQIPESAAR